MDQRLVIPAVAVAALVAGELAVVLTSTSQHGELRVVGHPEARVFVLLIGWSFIGSGLVAWHRRRTNRFGALMVAVGFAWFAAALTASNPACLVQYRPGHRAAMDRHLPACAAVVPDRPLGVAGDSADRCGLLPRRHGGAAGLGDVRKRAAFAGLRFVPAECLSAVGPASSRKRDPDRGAAHRGSALSGRRVGVAGAEVAERDGPAASSARPGPGQRRCLPTGAAAHHSARALLLRRRAAGGMDRRLRVHGGSPGVSGRSAAATARPVSCWRLGGGAE